MKLTESQFQRIFENKLLWKQVWIEIIADSARENQRKMQIGEAAHGPGTDSSSSGVPQPLNDSQISRAGSFPQSEFQRQVRDIGRATINKGAAEKKLRTVPRFEGSYEITTITPSRDPKYLKPETRNPVQIQRFDTTSDRRRGPEPTDPDAKVLVESWNRYRQPAEPRVRRIYVRKNRREVIE